mmetsp:Transcript_22395/g.76052  ORF Transcript_22395/g.76052 Transcript_22395/m.76052 type:complete len:411 (+) Transcript_22395:288-1520(+)
MDRRREPAHVARVDARHGDSPVARHVHGVVRGEGVHLLAGEAGVGEHPDLVRDVVPGHCGAALLQLRPELGAHADDAVRHHLNLLVPLLLQRRVREDRGDQRAALQRRVAVHRPRDGLHLALHRDGLVLGAAHDAEAPHALAVQPHVLREGLAAPHEVAVRQEQADRARVVLAVARREALVRHVEEREQLLLLEHRAQRSPLLGRRVHAGGVVRARVQQHNAAPVRSLQVLHHPLEVQPAGRRVVVAVLDLLHAGVAPDVVVVRPRRNRDEHLGVRVEPLHEVGHEAARARAGEGLHRRDAALRHGAAALAVRELHGLGAERLGAPDRQVLHESAAGELRLSLAHAVQHHGAALVVAVRAHTEVHLLRPLVREEHLVDAQDRVLRGLGDVQEPGVHGGGGLGGGGGGAGG